MWLCLRFIFLMTSWIARILAPRRADIVMENLLLRQQLIVLRRKEGRRIFFRPEDSALLGLFAGAFPLWKSALAIVRPETLLKWHREGFRIYWRIRSRIVRDRRKISPEIRALIYRLAHENPTWGAERIRGELLKLGFRVAKRSIQNILKRMPGASPRNGMSWKAFLRQEAKGIWACDFFRAVTIDFREVFVFVVIELHSRRILYWSTTDHPSSEWTHRQILQATWDHDAPKFLIHDRDDKFGPEFDSRLRRSLDIRGIRTPYRAPKANAFVERTIETLRHECLDRILLFGERHLRAVLKEYVPFYNSMRPHQGIDQKIPERPPPYPPRGAIKAHPILGGLQHHYFREAA